MHVYTHVHAWIRTYTCVDIQIQIHIYICTRVYTYIHICMYTYMYVYTHTCTWICTHTDTQTNKPWLQQTSLNSKKGWLSQLRLLREAQVSTEGSLSLLTLWTGLRTREPSSWRETFWPSSQLCWKTCCGPRGPLRAGLKRQQQSPSHLSTHWHKGQAFRFPC